MNYTMRKGDKRYVKYKNMTLEIIGKNDEGEVDVFITESTYPARYMMDEPHIRINLDKKLFITKMKAHYADNTEGEGFFYYDPGKGKNVEFNPDLNQHGGLEGYVLGTGIPGYYTATYDDQELANLLIDQKNKQSKEGGYVPIDEPITPKKKQSKNEKKASTSAQGLTDYSKKTYDVSYLYKPLIRRRTIFDQYSKSILMAALGTLFITVLLRLYREDEDEDIEEYFSLKKKENKLKEAKANSQAKLVKAKTDVMQKEKEFNQTQVNLQNTTSAYEQEQQDIAIKEKALKERRDKVMKAKGKPKTSKELLDTMQERERLNVALSEKQGMTVGGLEIGDGIVKAVSDVTKTGINAGEKLASGVIKVGGDVVNTGIGAVGGVVSSVAKATTQSLAKVGAEAAKRRATRERAKVAADLQDKRLKATAQLRKDEALLNSKIRGSERRAAIQRPIEEDKAKRAYEKQLTEEERKEAELKKIEKQLTEEERKEAELKKIEKKSKESKESEEIEAEKGTQNEPHEMQEEIEIKEKPEEIKEEKKTQYINKTFPEIFNDDIIDLFGLRKGIEEKKQIRAAKRKRKLEIMRKAEEGEKNNPEDLNFKINAYTPSNDKKFKRFSKNEILGGSRNYLYSIGDIDINDIAKIQTDIENRASKIYGNDKQLEILFRKNENVRHIKNLMNGSPIGLNIGLPFMKYTKYMPNKLRKLVELRYGFDKDVNERNRFGSKLKKDVDETTGLLSKDFKKSDTNLKEELTEKHPIEKKEPIEKKASIEKKKINPADDEPIEKEKDIIMADIGSVTDKPKEKKKASIGVGHYKSDSGTGKYIEDEKEIARKKQEEIDRKKFDKEKKGLEEKGKKKLLNEQTLEKVNETLDIYLDPSRRIGKYPKYTKNRKQVLDILNQINKKTVLDEMEVRYKAMISYHIKQQEKFYTLWGKNKIFMEYNDIKKEFKKSNKSPFLIAKRMLQTGQRFRIEGNAPNYKIEKIENESTKWTTSGLRKIKDKNDVNIKDLYEDAVKIKQYMNSLSGRSNLVSKAYEAMEKDIKG